MLKAKSARDLARRARPIRVEETPRFFLAGTDLADSRMWKVDESSPEGSGINKARFIGSEFCREGFRSLQGSPPGESGLLMEECGPASKPISMMV